MNLLKRHYSVGAIVVLSTLFLTGCGAGEEEQDTAALMKARQAACATQTPAPDTSAEMPAIEGETDSSAAAEAGAPVAETPAPDAAAAETPAADAPPAVEGDAPAVDPSAAADPSAVATDPAAAGVTCGTPTPTPSPTDAPPVTEEAPVEDIAGPSDYTPGVDPTTPATPSGGTGSSAGSSAGSAPSSNAGSGAAAPAARPATTTGGTGATPSTPSTGGTPAGSNPTNEPNPSTSTTPKPDTTPKPSVPEDFKSILHEKFDKEAKVGSWDQSKQSEAAYTGKDGNKWFAAPESISDVAGNVYRPGKTVSVHDGVLDINPQAVDGRPAGALITPAVNGSSAYQTYGKYSVTMKTVKPENPYRLTVALYPESGVPSLDGQAIFPDTMLNQASMLNGYYLYGGNGCSTAGCIVQATPPSVFDTTDEHIYSIEWTPDRLVYKIDNQVVLSVDSNIPTQPMRFQIAVNSTVLSDAKKDNDKTHVLISEVQVWSYTK